MSHDMLPAHPSDEPREVDSYGYQRELERWLYDGLPEGEFYDIRRKLGGSSLAADWKSRATEVGTILYDRATGESTFVRRGELGVSGVESEQ